MFVRTPSIDSRVGFDGEVSIVSSASQFSKQGIAIEETVEGSLIVCSDLQLVNALTPIEVRPSGIDTEVRLIAPLKAYLPIDVTPSFTRTVCIDDIHGFQGTDGDEKLVIFPSPEIVSVNEDSSYDHVRLSPQVPDVSARRLLVADKAYA